MQFRKYHEMKGCKLWSFLYPGAVKNMEKERIFTFQAFVKKANYLAQFND